MNFTRRPSGSVNLVNDFWYQLLLFVNALGLRRPSWRCTPEHAWRASQGAENAWGLRGGASGAAWRRRITLYGRSRDFCLALGGGRAAARPAPGLVPDGTVRHPSEAKLGQRADVVTLQAHQRDEHFVAFAVEDGGWTAAARLALCTSAGGRRARARSHRRGDFVEHDGREDEQADLTPRSGGSARGPPHPTVRSGLPCRAEAPSAPAEARPAAVPVARGRPPGRPAG
jgi:hypothetical protein